MSNNQPNLRQIFYSTQNFNLIKGIVSQHCQRQHHIPIGSEHDNLIQNIMNRVYKTGSQKNIPQGLTIFQYNQRLNNIVTDYSIKAIGKYINNKKISRAPEQSMMASHSSQFNPLPQQSNQVNYDMQNPQDAYTRPIASNEDDSGKHAMLMSQYQELEQNRGYDNSRITNTTAETPNQTLDQTTVIKPPDDPKRLYMNTQDVKDEFQLGNDNITLNIEKMEKELNGVSIMKENELNDNVMASNSMDPYNLTSNSNTGYHGTQLTNDNSGLTLASQVQPLHGPDQNDNTTPPKVADLRYAFNTGYPLVNPHTNDYVRRQWYVDINSRNRNLEVYPNSNYFQVKFSPTSDGFDVSNNLNPDGSVDFENVRKFLGDDKGASIPVGYNNILELRCISAIVPHASRFVSGIYPTKYNGARVDENDTTTAGSTAVNGQFKSWPYGPVYNSNNIGVPTNVLDEPYLMLEVPEIDGPYESTNTTGNKAFAKLIHDAYYGILTSFVQMRTAHNETRLYAPTDLGRLDRMTMELKKSDGLLYDFGQDKLFIESIDEGDEVDNNEAGCDFNGKRLTKIKISTDDPQYNGKQCSHGLHPGELIYLYDTQPCLSDVIYFNDINVPSLDIVSSTSIAITAIQTLSNGSTQNVDFTSFLEIRDVIALNNKLYTVIDFQNNGRTVIIEVPSSFNNNMNVTRFGFAKRIKRGTTSNNTDLLNYIGGFRVFNTVDDDPTSFYLIFPYECLPNHLKSDNGGTYEAKDIFFIKHKLQVSYTLEVVTLEKNYHPLTSEIIEKTSF